MDGIARSVLSGGILEAECEVVQVAERRVFDDVRCLAGNLACVQELVVESERSRIGVGHVDCLVIVLYNLFGELLLEDRGVGG